MREWETVWFLSTSTTRGIINNSPLSLGDEVVISPLDLIGLLHVTYMLTTNTPPYKGPYIIEYGYHNIYETSINSALSSVGPSWKCLKHLVLKYC